MMGGVVLLARSDGGAQVVDDYYQKAVDWDTRRAAQSRSDALGWMASIEVVDGRLQCVVRDAIGAGIEGLAVTVAAFRPQYTAVQAELSLVPAEASGHGLWDFEILAVRDTARFMSTLRMELYR
jgi:nitrogen fixation protein FixH